MKNLKLLSRTEMKSIVGGVVLPPTCNREMMSCSVYPDGDELTGVCYSHTFNGMTPCHCVVNHNGEIVGIISPDCFST